MSVPATVDRTEGADTSVKLEQTERPLGASPSMRRTVKRESFPTSPRPSRPRKTAEHFSCRDLGKYVDGVDLTSPPDAEASRLERKSKTQAMSAMAKGTSEGEGEAPNTQRHATRKAARMARLPSLVYDYMDVPPLPGAPAPVATAATTPRHVERPGPRVFGMKEAPTFYPSWDEFQDPLAYIEWVASPTGGNGVDYGIVKIVPPTGWQMDFVADEQTFRFRTRVQRLNELSAEGRVAQNYREQLEQFHAQQGHGRITVPHLGDRSLDLYALKLAARAAGVQATSEEAAWVAVARTMGLGDVHAAVLETAYTRLVRPFEEYLAQAKATRTEAPTAPETKEAAQHATPCTVCHTDDGQASVQCSDCEKRFHHQCLSPPLAQAPRGGWVCAACLVGTGADFGFDDGETHSLHSFWQRCGAFQRAWAARAAKKAPADAARWSRLATRSNADTTLAADEDLIEAEFWRLVHSTQERVDVEYGADIHSSTHGNASPTMERQPLNAYARSGWNMNNLPILPASLLRYIKSEISGMTVPWIYIGMMFSAFCWHSEDHYTYSVNYQHWGATKTWYGVPGADAAKFDAAMQRIAPELFEANPDLLLQLVTMMSPELAKREGVRTYALNQRPNEFVVTFPKAYHSGFNHGFNLNEAVNFALPEWVMDGLECAKRYQTFLRQPVFSHDELLVTISLHNQQLNTTIWLQDAYGDMVDRELEARQALRVQGVVEVLSQYDRSEAEYQCAYCKTLAYLSQVVVSGKTAVACPAHAADVHGQEKSKWTLRLRFSDTYLETQSAKLAERAAIPHAWQERARKLALQQPRPSLRTLRALVQEGEKITYPLPELAQLQAFLERATPWVERAQVFLTRRQKRSEHAPRGRGRREVSVPPPPASTDQDRSPEALLRLCEQVPSLPFDAPEFAGLVHAVDQMNAFRKDAAAFLAQDPKAHETHHKIDEAERVLGQGALLQVHVPEVSALRQWIAHVKWFSELHEIGEKFLTYEEVGELLHEAHEARIGDEHPQIHALLERRRSGEAWRSAALALLDGGQPIVRADLESLLDVSAQVATPTETRARVTSLQHKAAQWHEAVTDIHNYPHPDAASVLATADEPPRLAETRQVLADAAAAHVSLPFADELAQAVALHDRWNTELGNILRKTQPKTKGSDVVAMARHFCELTSRAAAASALAEWEEYYEAQARARTEADAAAAVQTTAAPGGSMVLDTPAAPFGESRAASTAATAATHSLPESSDASSVAPPAEGAPPSEAVASPLASPDAEPAVESAEAVKLSSKASPAAAEPSDGALAVPAPGDPAGAPPRSELPAAEPSKEPSSPPPTDNTPSAAAAPRSVTPAASSETGSAPTIPSLPAPAPCICFETLPMRTASVTCTSCETLYHLKCLDLRSKSLGKKWVCPLCDRSKLPALLQTRHAVSQLPLVALLQNMAFQRDRFRFLPSNYMALQAAIRATVEFGVAITMRFRSGALPSVLLEGGQNHAPEVTPLIREVTRRAVGCPVDVLLIADATPKQHVPSVLDALLPAYHLRPKAPTDRRSTPKPKDGTARAPRRSKRARLTFREEKPPASSDEVPVHCFCGQPDTGTMVQCDKCTLWFHNACMCIDDPEALQEKWFCPVCCLRMRRRYPFAEVRVADATPTAPPPPLPPHYFVDVQASLRSETAPVHKVQHWSNERRILLHLVEFEPAVLVANEKVAEPSTPADEPPAKRTKLSPELDRHLAGRLNLLRRGVSEAMMQRYAMGWNGEAIVCQLAPDRQVVLGPTIRLAPDDLDGTRLLRMTLEASWPPLGSREHRYNQTEVPVAHPPRPMPAPVPPRLPPINGLPSGMNGAMQPMPPLPHPPSPLPASVHVRPLDPTRPLHPGGEPRALAGSPHTPDAGPTRTPQYGYTPGPVPPLPMPPTPGASEARPRGPERPAVSVSPAMPSAAPPARGPGWQP